MIKNQKLNSRLSLKSTLIILSLLIAASSLGTSWQFASLSQNIDFFTWWAVPHTIASHRIEKIYSDGGRKELAQQAIVEAKSKKISFHQKSTLTPVLKLYDDQIITTATPFFYSALNRLVSHNYQKDRIKFILISMACAIASYILLGRMLRYSITGILLMSAFFLSIYSPAVMDVKVGNCNHIQLLMLSVFIWFFSREKNFYYMLTAGFILGLTIMLKPNMIFIVVFSYLLILIKKDFYKLPAFTIGILISAFISFFEGVMYFQNPRIWNEWFSTISDTISYSFTLEKGNYSLTKIIYDAAGLKTTAIIYLLIIAIFIVIILNRNKAETSLQKSSNVLTKKDEIADAFIIVGFGSISLLLACGLVWTHYYVLNIPLLFYLLRPQQESDKMSSNEFIPKALLGLILLLHSRNFIFFLNSEMIIALTYNFAIVVLFGLLIYDIRRRTL